MRVGEWRRASATSSEVRMAVLARVLGRPHLPSTSSMNRRARSGATGAGSYWRLSSLRVEHVASTIGRYPAPATTKLRRPANWVPQQRPDLSFSLRSGPADDERQSLGCLRLKTNSPAGGYVRDIYVRDITVPGVLDAGLNIDLFYSGGEGGRFNLTVTDIYVPTFQLDEVDGPGPRMATPTFQLAKYVRPDAARSHQFSNTRHQAQHGALRVAWSFPQKSFGGHVVLTTSGRPPNPALASTAELPVD